MAKRQRNLSTQRSRGEALLNKQDILARSGFPDGPYGCYKLWTEYTCGSKDMNDARFLDAYRDTIYMASQSDLNITEENIRHIHKVLYQAEMEFPGEYRAEEVSIIGSTHRFPACKDVPKLMEEFAARIPEILTTTDPVTAAATLHQELVDIHPFLNGNGRVARLLMNAVLLHNGFFALTVTPDWREEYSLALRKSQLYGDREPFLSLIRQKVSQNEETHKKEVT